MPQREISSNRRVIDNYYQEVLNDSVIEEPKNKETIPFRSDRSNNKQRSVWHVPVNILRFRLDNSRLNAEVKTYEKSGIVLDDENDEHQKMVGEWLNGFPTNIVNV